MSILVVGMICYDVVNTCERFPYEDEEMRCVGQREQQGGNAANSSYVLGLLNSSCEFYGTIGKGPRTDFVLKRLDQVGVSHDHCVCYADKTIPNSNIMLSLATGTRTTVHYRDKGFPELTFDDFKQLDLSPYKWIHFETRGEESDLLKMVQRVIDYNLTVPPGRRITISLEFEKYRETVLKLMPLSDVLLVGKEFARHLGYKTSEEAVNQLRMRAKSALIICAWGEHGASASGPDGEVIHVDAHTPGPVIDTLGAGDTFNAAVIHSLARGVVWKESVKFSCRVAGTKCCSPGYEQIKSFASN